MAWKHDWLLWTTLRIPRPGAIMEYDEYPQWDISDHGHIRWAEGYGPWQGYGSLPMLCNEAKMRSGRLPKVDHQARRQKGQSWVNIPRAILTSFETPPPFKAAVAMHLDDNRYDDCWTNFLWGTPVENARRAKNRRDRVTKAPVDSVETYQASIFGSESTMEVNPSAQEARRLARLLQRRDGSPAQGGVWIPPGTGLCFQYLCMYSDPPIRDGEGVELRLNQDTADGLSGSIQTQWRWYPDQYRRFTLRGLRASHECRVYS